MAQSHDMYPNKNADFSQSGTSPPMVVSAVTITTEPQQNATNYDISYLRSPTGVIMVFIALHSFIGMIVLAAGSSSFYLGGAFGCYITVMVLSFLYASSSVFTHLFGVRQKFNTIHWIIIDFIAYGLLIFMLFISSCLLAARCVIASDGASTVMGFFVLQGYIVCIALVLPNVNQHMTHERERHQEQIANATPYPVTVTTHDPPSYMQTQREANSIGGAFSNAEYLQSE